MNNEEKDNIDLILDESDSDYFDDSSDNDDQTLKEDIYDYEDDYNLNDADYDPGNDISRSIKDMRKNENLSDLDLLKKDYKYPSTHDPEFQSKLYYKREFQINRQPNRPNINNYEELEKARNEICSPLKFSLQNHQALLANYITPDTPYKGILVFHNLGTGKTITGVAISRNFIDQIVKNNTKIYILCPSTYIKANWRDEILLATGTTYFNNKNINDYVSVEEKEFAYNNAMVNVLKNYRIITYKSFYKKVTGEKISDRIINDDGTIKVVYRKTDTGDFERDISIDKIHDLNNTLLIVDEAHNISNNEYGIAVSKIIERSINLKVVLLTGTPMKNLADDIIPLFNLILPKDNQMERDKLFTSDKNYLMKFKPNAESYFKQKTRGLISYMRGSGIIVFAKKKEMGLIPKGLKFTKLTGCKMMDFQNTVYQQTVTEKEDEDDNDTLDRKSTAISNFVIPGIGDSDKLIGLFSNNGINTIKNQLKTKEQLLNKAIFNLIKKHFPDETDKTNWLFLNEDKKNFTGRIFDQPFLKLFSTKFDTCLNNLNKLVIDKNGPQTAFIYSNLVKSGIMLFQEVLIRNGCLEYNENNNYILQPNTKCYYCGRQYKDHPITNDKNIPSHKFAPTTFILITGKSADEAEEQIPEEKQKILRNVFSNIKNIDGKFIKYVLGSKVMNEGISLK